MLKLRLFNGTTFGPAHVVPASGGYGPGWFYFDQDPSGRSHVFSDRSDAPITYHLYMQTTTTGAAWTGKADLGNGIDSDYFGSALDSIGSGLVVGTSGSFSFSSKGSAIGTADYRAVVSDFAGYLQYGYSAGRALKVT